MSTTAGPNVLVCGVGHPDRGDDAAGCLVAEHLEGVDRLEVRRVTGDPTALLTDDAWDAADTVVLVDAVRTGAPVGTVHVLDADDPRLASAATGGGTHDLGLAATLQLARAVRRLPAALIVVGIEAGPCTLGTGPGPAVSRAAARVARLLVGGPATATGARASEEGDRVPR